MTERNLIKRLLDFGFTKDESEVYLFLQKAGSCPARLIARKFGINRMKTYRILKALEDRDIVEVTLERPVRFVAIPLKEVIDRYMEKVRVNLSHLEKSKKEIIEDWEKLHKLEIPIEKPKFRILQGRKQIYGFLLQMYERAKSEIRLITTRNDLIRLSLAGIDDKLKNFKHAGVMMQMLTQIDKSGIKTVENYLGFAEGRHITLNTSLRLAIIDESEVITTVDMDDSMSMTTRRDTGLWTNAPSYVNAMRTFFEALWRTAPDAREVANALKAGRTPEEIRIIGTQEEYIKSYKQMLESSKQEIIILMKQIQDFPLTIQDLETTSDRGIKIRLLTEIDLESLTDINLIKNLVQVMHHATTTNLRLLVKDQTEVLLQVPRREGMGQFIWSNLKSYVTTMNQVFEDYWKDGVPAEDILPKLVAKQTIMEGINLAKKGLKEAGWIVEVPGELVGELGLRHSFGLVARLQNQPNRSVVLDLIVDEKATHQIIALGAKAMDIKPTTKLLATTKPFDKRESELAELYDIRPICSAEAKQLATKIIVEASRL